MTNSNRLCSEDVPSGLERLVVRRDQIARPVVKSTDGRAPKSAHNTRVGVRPKVPKWRGTNAETMRADELGERRPDAAHAAQTREPPSRLRRPRHQAAARKPAPMTAIPAIASSTKWLPVTTIVRMTSGG